MTRGPLVFFFFFPFFTIFNFQNVYALDISITEKELGFGFRVEYDRAFLSLWGLSAMGAIELNGNFSFSGGILFGKTEAYTGIKTFAGVRHNPWENMPLDFSFVYVFNGLPEYEAHSHTILPLVSLNGRWAGIAIGPGLRFSSFFGEPALFESSLSFSGYVNLINNQMLQAGISCGNFDDFYVGNTGAYWLAFYGLLSLKKHWYISNELALHQSGSTGLSTAFYGIAFRGGVRYKW
jgi:hypothetical protein